MKKNLFYIAASLTLLIGTACKKTTTSTNPAPTSETITATIDANQSYKYSLPEGFSSESTYFETTGAASATVGVETDNSGSAFVYIPPQDFNGTDEVVISNAPVPTASGDCGRNNGCKARKRHHGNCNKGEARHSITFKLIVNAVKN